jgi:ABC-type molybdenum transport system ATPase subunit/photorepair protein PhrA
MDLQARVADELAKKALELAEETGNPDIIDDIKKVIGTSSTTLEEAYMTAVRVRRAESRALELIEAKRTAFRATGA